MKKARYAVIDYRAAERVKNELLKYACEIIPTVHQNTYESICGHADIQLCRIDDKTAVCAPNCYEYYKNHLSGVNIVCGEKNPGESYPGDVLYNACCAESFAMHNFKYTDKAVLRAAQKRFKRFVNVKQGYSCCASCAAGDFVITEDDGIYNALLKNNIKALKISSGSVELPGMNYGFFGGATGFFGGTVFTVGEIDKHTDFEIIGKFLGNKNIDIVSLCSGKLRDTGSVLFF